LKTPDAQVSLRAAIIAANAMPGHNTINRSGRHYTLTIPGSNEYLAATGDLNIMGALTITGAERTARSSTPEGSLMD